MSRFVFPQPPPASLRFQQQQPAISPFQALQLGLQIRGQQQRAQRQQAEDARKAQREDLQLEKLQLDVARQRSEQTRERVGRAIEGGILTARDRPQREERTQQLEQLFPRRALEFRAKRAATMSDEAQAASIARKDFVLENNRKHAALSQLKRVNNLSGENRGLEAQQLLTAYQQRVANLEAAGIVDPGELPTEPLRNDQITALQNQLTEENRIAFSATDFQGAVDDKLAEEAFARGFPIGSPEYMQHVKEGLKLRRQAARTRARTGGGIQIQLPGAGTALGRAAAGVAEKDIVSASDITGQLSIIDETLASVSDPDRILGYFPQLGVSAVNYLDRFGADGLADRALQELGMTEADHYAAVTLSAALTDLIDAYRRMVTGLAAPEAELKRIEGKLTAVMKKREFRPRLEAYRLRTLRSLFIREQMLHEGINKGLVENEAEFNALVARKNGIKNHKFFGPLSTELWRRRARMGTKSQLANEVLRWRQENSRLTRDQILHDMYGEGYIDLEMGEAFRPGFMQFLQEQGVELPKFDRAGRKITPLRLRQLPPGQAGAAPAAPDPGAAPAAPDPQQGAPPTPPPAPPPRGRFDKQLKQIQTQLGVESFTPEQQASLEAALSLQRNVGERPAEFIQRRNAAIEAAKEAIRAAQQ